jgi:PAS domain S-box-containing protein
MNPRLKLEVCAFFVDEFQAALVAEGHDDVEIAPIQGACDERRQPAHIEAPPTPSDAPVLRLMGACSGGAACPNGHARSPLSSSPPEGGRDIVSLRELHNQALHSCFEFLLGPDKVDALLGEGAHLLTPAMVRAYPETLQSWNETTENLHAYFAESVRTWVVVDIGVAPLTAAEQAAFLDATGGKMEPLPTEPHLLRANLRAALAQWEAGTIEARLAGQIASLQHRLADYTMAYDMISRLIPHQGEQTIVNAILELFYMLCAPRAAHLLLVQDAGKDGDADAVEEQARLFSMPTGSGKENRLRAFLRCPSPWGEIGSPHGFYFRIRQGQQTLGVVVIEGAFLPERQRNYLDLALLLMPILRLALHNARSYERLCSTERELRASQTELEQRVEERTRELRESEARFRDRVNSTDGMVWEADAATFNFTFISQQAERLLGYPVEEWLKPGFWVEHLHPGDKVWATEYCASCTQRLESHDFEYRFIARDGRTVWLRDIVTVVAENGMPRWLRGIMVDITERKEYEEELKRSNTELEQFSYAVSHDMRQPLRMISSYLQLLEMGLVGQLDDEKRSYFNFAIDGAKRIDQMLVALLEYSRIGRMGEPPTWIDSRAAFDEALQFLQPAIAEAQARLDISGDWPRIFASHDEIQRLIQNLIGNAAKFRVAGRAPEITVTSKVDKNEWYLSVADNGVGIIPDQIKRLFQVFQRLQLRTAYEGNGVGLALCRKIVEHHKGRIWAESAGEGRGSKFCAVLPVLRDVQSSGYEKTEPENHY